MLCFSGNCDKLRQAGGTSVLRRRAGQRLFSTKRQLQASNRLSLLALARAPSRIGDEQPGAPQRDIDEDRRILIALEHGSRHLDLHRATEHRAAATGA